MSLVRRSLVLALADNYISLLCQLAGTMVIARLLNPEQVGVFAIAAAFAALATVVRDFGVAEYLIQERALTREKIAAALALNIAASWSMAAAMFLGAPWLASFYRHEGVAEVLQILALGFLLVPFGAVTMAWFRKELDFRPVMICNVAANVTNLVASVALALLGFGAASLAWATVAGVAVTVALALLFRPASVPCLPGLTGIAQVFHFSKFAGMLYVCGQAVKGAPEFIIGRTHGAVEVAFFSRGNGLVEMFHRLVMRAAIAVCMPYLALADRASGVIAPAYLRGVSYLTVIGWPLLGFLGLAAASAVEIVYGPQWHAAVPLAQLLCAACAIELVHALAREALVARGFVRQANSLQFALAGFHVLGLLLVIPFGLLGAAWGVVVASTVGTIASHWLLARKLGLRLRELLASCLPSLVVTALALAPASLWTLTTGVMESNHIVFGLLGGLLTAATWFVAVVATRHPIAAEFEQMRRKFKDWMAARSA